MTTLSQIADLRAKADRLKLAGVDLLDTYSDVELLGIYNGAGPDKWSQITRDGLTMLMRLFAPAVLIHDTQFDESDGKRSGFEFARDCWIANCKKLLDDAYPLCTWRQLIPSYRRERIYWASVMAAGNLAVSGKSAYAAWVAAYHKKLMGKGDAGEAVAY